jgi:hypothetical protein
MYIYSWACSNNLYEFASHSHSRSLYRLLKNVILLGHSAYKEECLDAVTISEGGLHPEPDVMQQETH